MTRLNDILWSLLGGSLMFVIFLVEPEDYTEQGVRKKIPKSYLGPNNPQNTLKELAWVLSITFLVCTILNDVETPGS